MVLAPLFKQFHAPGGVRLLELFCVFARLAQLLRLRFDFPVGRGEFARQCGAASPFLVQRMAMLLRTGSQLLSCGGGLLRESGQFLSPLLA